MPSTLVHMAFAALVAAALLQTSFDRRAVLVVMAAAAVPDLDAFIGLFFVAGHRTVLHTYLFPLALGVLFAADTRWRADSFVRRRWGEWGVAVGWTSLLGMAVAGIGLDFVEAGVNPLWPLHDQFYVLNGKLELSNQRGIVQTFVEVDIDLGGGSGGDGGGTNGGDGGGGISIQPESRGSSQEVNVTTGIEPDPDNSEENPERIFPVVETGWELLLMLTGYGVAFARLRRED